MASSTEEHLGGGNYRIVSTGRSECTFCIAERESAAHRERTGAATFLTAMAACGNPGLINLWSAPHHYGLPLTRKHMRLYYASKKWDSRDTVVKGRTWDQMIDVMGEDNAKYLRSAPPTHRGWFIVDDFERRPETDYQPDRRPLEPVKLTLTPDGDIFEVHYFRSTRPEILRQRVGSTQFPFRLKFAQLSEAAQRYGVILPR